jgi:arabinose-5-phosphate isomerase
MLRDKDVPLCAPQEKLVDTLVVLSNKRCGCVLIVAPDNTLLGIFTDGDLRRSLQKLGPKALESSMEELMTRTPRFISPEDMAAQALSLMEADRREVTVLPVVAEGKVVGILKMHDIVQSGL